MAKLIQGVRDLFRRHGEVEAESEAKVEEVRPIVVGPEEIEKVLPHRGRMLLLDKVIVTPAEVRGELLVTTENCEDHVVLNGERILKGSDLLDMAAQLLGIWCSKKKTLRGRQGMVREYGRAKFTAPVRAGELISVSVESVNLTASLGRIRGQREVPTTARGEKFIVRSDFPPGVIKARIEFVELVLF